MAEQDSADDEEIPEEPHLAKVKPEIETLCVADTDEENIHCALTAQFIPLRGREGDPSPASRIAIYRLREPF